MAAVDRPTETAVLVTASETNVKAGVDWPAIVAGSVIAAAISFALFTFGTGIGLSISSPYPSEGVSAPIFAIVLALWILLVTVMSFLVGGYFTGLLMRRRVLPDHELEMRDGMHGALSWALGVILGALITFGTVAGAARTGTEAAASVAASPASYFADMLLRSENPAAVAPAETELRRGEITRILLRNTTGDVTVNDRAYLSQLVTRQTGLPQPEAAARVDTVVGEFRSAANKARKFAAVLAFAVAATLAVGAAAAWWGALQGGEHRDRRADLTSHIGWRIRETRKIS